jgi:L-ascorbate metabolism protein UlaG (beta-lactamase superfamily)
MKLLFTLFGSVVLLFSLLLTPHSSLPSAAGQEPKKEPGPKEPSMTIRWFGQSFFQVETSTGRKFAFDPHAIPAFGRRMVPAEFVIVSHSHEDHSVVEMIDTGKVDEKTKEPKRIPETDVIRGVVEPRPGKQDWKTIDEKRGNIKIRNVACYHDTNNGLTRGKNSIFLVEADGLVICHLGDLGHELTNDQVKAIGKVDVLMIPIGGIYTINGEQAQAVMKQLKPRLFVLPMHYGLPGFDDLAGPEEFLDGLKNVKKTPGTNELVFPIDTKPESPTVVMLGWKKADDPPPPKDPKKDPKDPKKP